MKKIEKGIMNLREDDYKKVNWTKLWGKEISNFIKV